MKVLVGIDAVLGILAVVNRKTKKECTYLFEKTARAKQNVAFTFQNKNSSCSS